MVTISGGTRIIPGQPLGLRQARSIRVYLEAMSCGDDGSLFRLIDLSWHLPYSTRIRTERGGGNAEFGPDRYLA